MSTPADRFAAKVASLRAKHDAYALPDTCEIQRKVTTTDSRNNVVSSSWEADGSPVRCAIDVSGLQGAERVTVAGMETTDLPYEITLPYSADVDESKRIVSGSRTFELTAVRKGGAYDVATVAFGREVR